MVAPLDIKQLLERDDVGLVRLQLLHNGLPAVFPGAAFLPGVERKDFERLHTRSLDIDSAIGKALRSLPVDERLIREFLRSRSRWKPLGQR